jgi:hypothetical protein
MLDIYNEPPTNGKTAYGVMNKIGSFKLLFNFGIG